MKFFRKIEEIYLNLMVYNDRFYQWIDNNAGPSAKDVVEILIKYFNPSSVIDAGCGTGIYLQEFRKRGIKIKGIEWSKSAFAKAVIDKNDILPHDLRVPLTLNEKFDLGISFEVGQYFKKKYSRVFIRNLTSLSNRIIFSSAIPGQGGKYHINEQPHRYWIDLFEKEGYLYREKETENLRNEMRKRNVIWYIPQNTMIFERV